MDITAIKAIVDGGIVAVLGAVLLSLLTIIGMVILFFGPSWRTMAREAQLQTSILQRIELNLTTGQEITHQRLTTLNVAMNNLKVSLPERREPWWRVLLESVRRAQR